MREKKLNRYIALTFITLNFGILLLVLACWRLGAFDFDQFTTIVSAIVPMFSCYAVAAGRYIVKERYKKEDESQLLDPVFVFKTLMLPLAFAGAITLTILFQANGKVFRNFEEFQRMLLLVEFVFGGYMGQTMYRILSSPKSLDSSE